MFFIGISNIVALVTGPSLNSPGHKKLCCTSVEQWSFVKASLRDVVQFFDEMLNVSLRMATNLKVFIAMWQVAPLEVFADVMKMKTQ